MVTGTKMYSCALCIYTIGCKSGQTALGRIVVHDRTRVESDILPRYFNHASFASLRRQLNYFSFTRIGKGRQRGATYCNEGVIELHDILLLKRRSTNNTPASPHEENYAIVEPSEVAEQTEMQHQLSATFDCVVPVVHLPPPKKRRSTSGLKSAKPKKARAVRQPESSPTIVSPVSASPMTSDEEDESNSRVVLDLTVPASRHEVSYRAATASWHLGSFATTKDEDIMAGCNALLSFSNRTSCA